MALAVHTDAGYVPAFAGIGDENVSVNGGQIIRTDFLDAIGKEMPTTYDELEDVLTGFKNELNVPSPYWSNPAGYVVEMTAGYGIYRNMRWRKLLAECLGKCIYTALAG